MRPVAHKFGGSSVANAERIQKVASILSQRKERQVVVVSAMQGVTDELIRLVNLAAEEHDWQTPLAALKTKHLEAARALLGAKEIGALEPVEKFLDAEFTALHALLQTQHLLGAVSPDVVEIISGLGEVWSSRLLHEHFRSKKEQSEWLDARDVLVVHRNELGAHVDWKHSSARLTNWLNGRDPERIVITGFIARLPSGQKTTLGRNGSDYSGAIFAALFDSSTLHIWTDVNGVLSADPRVVPEAKFVSHLSYSEACELAYFGAKVVHPQTMSPAISRNIPIRIRSTFAPTDEGTLIDSSSDAAVPVKGVTTFSGLALINIEGAGMIGVPGTAERAFQALQRAKTSIVMISQGSSEHSICCVLQEKDAQRAQQALRDAFAPELHAKQIQDVTCTSGIAVLAVVGDGMAGTPGVAARLFAALARAGVNVRAIAQGSSERNISVAVSNLDAPKALRAVHAAFYLSAQTLSVGVIGPGNVGKALLRQIDAAKERLAKDSGLELRVRGVAASKTMQLAEAYSATTAQTPPAPLELTRFADHIQADHLPHSVIIDCTASDQIADHYAQWLGRGIHVVTPNKHAGSGPMQRYQAITQATRNGNAARFKYESTVGAGLPVIQTLRDLLDTGDRIIAIEGILSGTLAYLFNVFDGSTPFSKLVRDAKDRGYTEPDPRDDLSGLDVARKLVILARECNWPTSLESVELENLVPTHLQRGTAAEFLNACSELDTPMLEKVRRAHGNNHVLRYVARLEAGAAKVGLVELPKSHAFAHIRLTDNVVQFTTERYRDNPLVVQGPGAGPEVTAAGIFSDLLRIGTSLGARL